jgi:hypothetical protein
MAKTSREIKLAEKALRSKSPDATIYSRTWTDAWKWLRDERDSWKKQGVSGTSFYLLDATINLLEGGDMNIKGPTGFKKEWFADDVINALDKVGELCYEIDTTMTEVISEAKAKGIKAVGNAPHPKSVLRKLKESADWVPREFAFYFKDKNWGKVEDPSRDPSLLVSFDLQRRSEGISVSLYWPCPPKEQEKEEVEKEVKALNKTLGKRSFYPYLVDGGLYIQRDVDFKRFEGGEQALETFVEELDATRNFTNKLANKLNALRKALGYKTSRKRAG